MRKKISYTVEESTVKKFNEVCKIESVNKSALIEQLILSYIRLKESDRENRK